MVYYKNPTSENANLFLECQSSFILKVIRDILEVTAYSDEQGPYLTSPRIKKQLEDDVRLLISQVGYREEVIHELHQSRGVVANNHQGQQAFFTQTIRKIILLTESFIGDGSRITLKYFSRQVRNLNNSASLVFQAPPLPAGIVIDLTRNDLAAHLIEVLLNQGPHLSQQQQRDLFQYVVDTLEYLGSLEADLAAPNAQGKCAVELVIAAERLDLLEVLYQADQRVLEYPKTNPPVMRAAKLGHLDILQFILSHIKGEFTFDAVLEIMTTACKTELVDVQQYLASQQIVKNYLEQQPRMSPTCLWDLIRDYSIDHDLIILPQMQTTPKAAAQEERNTPVVRVNVPNHPMPVDTPISVVTPAQPAVVQQPPSRDASNTITVVVGIVGSVVTLLATHWAGLFRRAPAPEIKQQPAAARLDEKVQDNAHRDEIKRDADQQPAAGNGVRADADAKRPNERGSKHAEKRKRQHGKKRLAAFLAAAPGGPPHPDLGEVIVQPAPQAPLFDFAPRVGGAAPPVDEDKKIDAWQPMEQRDGYDEGAAAGAGARPRL